MTSGTTQLRFYSSLDSSSDARVNIHRTIIKPSSQSMHMLNAPSLQKWS